MEIQVPIIYAGVNGLVRVPFVFLQTFRLILVVVVLYSSTKSLSGRPNSANTRHRLRATGNVAPEVEANLKKVVEAPSSHCSAPIYILAIAAFILLQIPTALATNYGMLMASFPAGFFSSLTLATGGATIADLYAPKKRAYGMTLWGVFATFAPSLGPFLGSFSACFEGWQWTIWVLLWLSSATFILLIFFPKPSHSTPSTAERATSTSQPETPRILDHGRSRDHRSSYVTPS